MSCMIVCPTACRNCPAIACKDRIAELDEVKERDLQAKCAMRSDISCRHCHEEDCKIRKADRRF
jgi:hypothetical protein